MTDEPQYWGEVWNKDGAGNWKKIRLVKIIAKWEKFGISLHVDPEEKFETGDYVQIRTGQVPND